MAMTRLDITLTPDSLCRFTTLLQSGIQLSSSPGEPLSVFLAKLPGFSTSYIGEKLQTIFLDGNPVDDLTIPFARSPTTLALSAAMPGLAGAIFRRNGHHASLRGVSKQDAPTPDCDEINVTLKLFNTIASEVGPALLSSGVIISSQHLQDYFSKRPSLFEEIVCLHCEDKSMETKDLIPFLSAHNSLHVFMKEADVTTT